VSRPKPLPVLPGYRRAWDHYASAWRGVEHAPWVLPLLAELADPSDTALDWRVLAVPVEAVRIEERLRECDRRRVSFAGPHDAILVSGGPIVDKLARAVATTHEGSRVVVLGVMHEIQHVLACGLAPSVLHPTHWIDTGGVYIPGHASPTGILVLRRQPEPGLVHALICRRGEPSTPADPALGLAWQALLSQVSEPGSQSEYWDHCVVTTEGLLRWARRRSRPSASATTWRP